MGTDLESSSPHGLAAGLALAALLVAHAPASAQTQPPAWARVTPGMHGEMLALDKDNNVCVAGSVPWSTIAIQKYAASGDLLWQRTFDNPGTREQSAWVSVDASGHCIVTGYIIGSDAGAASGLIVLKYSPMGALMWHDVIRSASGYASRAATDAAGHVYVIGRTLLSGADRGATRRVAALMLIKYTPSGTRLWSRDLGFDRESADAPASLLVTPAGTAVVAGGTDGKMLLAALDSSGNLISSKSLAVSPGDIAIGPSGEFYVVGGPHANSAPRNFLVIKHDANFNELWRRTYPVGRWGWRVAVDSLGHAIVAGVSADATPDWVTIKLDADGALLWTRRYGGGQSGDQIPFAIAVGPDDAVYVTGQGGPRSASPTRGESNTVTVKYAADGTLRWADASPVSNRALSVKLGSDDSVFIVGEFPLSVIRYTQGGR